MIQGKEAKKVERKPVKKKKIQLTEEEKIYNALPGKVKNIINSLNEDADPYQEAKRMLEKLEEINWTADFGLSGELYDIKPLEKKQVVKKATTKLVTETDGSKFLNYTPEETLILSKTGYIKKEGVKYIQAKDLKEGMEIEVISKELKRPTKMVISKDGLLGMKEQRAVYLNYPNPPHYPPKYYKYFLEQIKIYPYEIIEQKIEKKQPETKKTKTVTFKGNPIEILYGKHEVKDYPYGRLRTSMFFNVEFNPKRGYRSVRQTINPKTGRLNNPKKSTYSTYMLLYKDLSTGYLNFMGFSPDSFGTWLGLLELLKKWNVKLSLNEEMYLTENVILIYKASLYAMINYSYGGYNASESTISYLKEYGSAMYIWLGVKLLRKKIFENYVSIMAGEKTIFSYIPLFKDIILTENTISRFVEAKAKFDPVKNDYLKKLEKSRLLAEKNKKPEKAKPDPTKDRPTKKEVEKQIKEILKNTIPNFVYSVEDYNYRFGRKETDNYISIKIGIHKELDNANGMPQQTDLLLDYNTMKLETIRQRNSTQGVRRKDLSGRNAWDKVKIPFRTPKPEWKYVKKAIQNYVTKYRDEVFKALDEDMLYLAFDIKGKDFSFLKEGINGLEENRTYQEIQNNYMQSFLKVP